MLGVYTFIPIATHKASAADDVCDERRLRDLGVLVVTCDGDQQSDKEKIATCGGASNENQKCAFDILVSAGYTEEQAAGVVANIIHESGVNPTRMQCVFSRDEKWGVSLNLLEADGGVLANNALEAGTQLVSSGKCSNVENITKVGWGIVQWTPFSKIIERAQGEGQSFQIISTLEFQFTFLIDQLNGTGIGGKVANEKAAGDMLKSATTVEQATEAFAVGYERCADCKPGSPTVTGRIETAIDVLIRFGS